MIRVLIGTEVRDTHTLAVAHLLKLKGHQPVLWYGADFPTRQQSSIQVSPEEFTWEVSGPSLDLANTPFDVVWYRRTTLPVLPEDMHPGDRKVADLECRALVQGLWRLVAPEAFWVNPLSGRDRANSKPVQLLEARHSGLKVPPTLFSNDPDKIRRFIEQHGNDVIYKPFWPAFWDKGDDGIALLYTSAVGLDDLPDDEILRLSPGIFQPRIEKAYELRVTYMGDYPLAVKLFSQENSAFELDWRNVFTSSTKDMRIEAADLPEEIQQACRILMKNLGIVFGCFDFIVTPQGEHVFLEVNEMGQFLWIEELNPEIRLLEPFTDFLIGRGLSRDWRPSRNGVSMHDFRSDLASRHLQEDALLHLERPNEYAVNE